MKLTAVLTRADEGGYVALNPETGTTSQGETVEAAMTNLRNATILLLGEFPLNIKRGALVTTFEISPEILKFDPSKRAAH